MEKETVYEEVNSTVISLCKFIKEKVENDLIDGLPEVVKATAELVSAADRMLV